MSHPYALPVACTVTDRATIPPAELCGVRIYAEYSPAGELGGDFYTLSGDPQAGFSLLIGDVCGRGHEAARLVGKLRPTLEALGRSGLTPAQQLSELNRAACQALPQNAFATAVCLSIAPGSYQLRVANAGHVPPLVRSASAQPFVVGRASGPPLGMLSEAVYDEARTDLHPGDVLLLMTDGVLEALETDLVGMPRLLDLLSAWGSGPEGLRQRIVQDVRRSSRVRGRDDLTLLCHELAGALGVDELPRSRPSTASLH